MTKMIKILFLLVSTILPAQTAKVIELSPQDQVLSKNKHDDLVRAQKASDDWNTYIQHKYIEKKSGWEFGYQFSEDYKFIVPKSYILPGVFSGIPGNITSSGNITCSCGWCSGNYCTCGSLYYYNYGNNCSTCGSLYYYNYGNN
jgi:hypothetical protein